MDIKEVLEYYVDTSTNLHCKTWEAINVLFPNLDLDFFISQPKERQAIIDNAKFLQKLPKGTEVCLQTDVEMEGNNLTFFFIYLPQDADHKKWDSELEWHRTNDYGFALKQHKESE